MLLIKNGRVMDPKSGLTGDALVEGKKIVKIAKFEAPAQVLRVLVVAPGLVDIHVHFRSRARLIKKTFTGA